MERIVTYGVYPEELTEERKRLLPFYEIAPNGYIIDNSIVKTGRYLGPSVALYSDAVKTTEDMCLYLEEINIASRYESSSELKNSVMFTFRFTDGHYPK